MNFINSVKGKILIGFVIALAIFFSVDGGANMTGYGATAFLHVLSGVVWIGLLYYFNFVQVPAMGEALSDTDGPGPAAIGKYIAPRALLWFRMSAASTLVIGLVLLALEGRGFSGIVDAFTLSDTVIGIGVWMGVIMVFNVWFIIWPSQKKILGMKEASADEIATAKKRAALASSINVILSIPLLLTMIAWH